MLAEVLIITPTTNGDTVASLEVPSAVGDDSTVVCGHVAVPTTQDVLSHIDVYLSQAFLTELEPDGPVDNDALEAEEDLLIQAIRLELPRLLAGPIAPDLTFRVTTPNGNRTIKVTDRYLDN
jgi:hypothetical protein